MKAIFIFLLFSLWASSAVAFIEGSIIRGGADGNLIIWKMEGGKCFAVNLKIVKEKVPTVWTSAFQVLMIGIQPMRPLTVPEKELCTGTPVVIPVETWLVHDNSPNDPTRTTRPGYTLQEGLLIKHKKERVDIGESCGAQAVTTSRNIQYRYLNERNDRPNRPTGFIGLCVQAK